MQQAGGQLVLDGINSLQELFLQRVRLSPAAVAYRFHDAASDSWQQRSWWDTAEQVARWQRALSDDGLQAGDRVAVMSANRWEWVIFDQAALGLGLVVVPIYTNDRPENLAWIIGDSGARLLLLENQQQWDTVVGIVDQLPALKHVVCLEAVAAENAVLHLRHLPDWLPATAGELQTRPCSPDELATIVYTSGTTGRPKGVMLSHRNILWNIAVSLACFEVRPDDVFLSFLPLSHAFERTVGYYLPMACGSAIAYNRGIPLLAEDLQIVRPTLMISVPRIFERVYGRIMDKLSQDAPLRRRLFALAVELGWGRYLNEQGRGPWQWRFLLQPLLDRLVGAKVRARLGGRLRFAVSGGAPLSPQIAETFIGLGVIVLQGYGLTETSPTIAGNVLDNNDPATVGMPLPGIEVKTGRQDELLTRSPSVMLGYWNNPEATAAMIDSEGWLHTGDRVAIDEAGRIRITGRLKDIIVLANGEKVAPADMESAIALDPLFEQVLVVGEGRPFLTALVVPETAAYQVLLRDLGLRPDAPSCDGDETIQSILLDRMRQRLEAFPGYARIYRLAVLRDPWSVDNGLLTPTLKLRRNRILARYEGLIAALYQGH